ncbi:hypothetical protein KCU73_g161, partial [Aureobasidium melanogenum]
LQKPQHLRGLEGRWKTWGTGIEGKETMSRLVVVGDADGSYSGLAIKDWQTRIRPGQRVGHAESLPPVLKRLNSSIAKGSLGTSYGDLFIARGTADYSNLRGRIQRGSGVPGESPRYRATILDYRTAVRSLLVDDDN